MARHCQTSPFPYFAFRIFCGANRSLTGVRYRILRYFDSKQGTPAEILMGHALMSRIVENKTYVNNFLYNKKKQFRTACSETRFVPDFITLICLREAYSRTQDYISLCSCA
jgi:hypothetical protein